MFWMKGTRSGSWSMLSRIILLNAATSFGVLACVAFIVYSGLARHSRHAGHAILEDEMGEMRALLTQRDVEPTDIREEIQVEDNPRHENPLYIRVLKARGKTWMEADGMARLGLTPDRFPPPGKGAALWKAPGDRRFLLAADKVPSGREIQVCLDLTKTHEFLEGYWYAILGAFALGLGASVFAGVLLASRSLAPLQEISRAARRIGSSQLHERISSPHWPRELAGLAADFDAMLSRLEESFKRLSQFSADLAHECRTPVHNLRLQSEVALSRPRSAEEYREALESGLEETERLSAMIDSLLFLARAESGTAGARAEVFDGAGEMEKVRDYFLPTAEEKGVRLSCRGGAEVKADPILFRRALSNLVANAVEYTPPGGEIEVTLGGDGRETLVAVRDSGCGIAPEHHARIFDRLYRVDPSRSKHPGMGLGLALVKSIAQLHGGAVDVASEPGRGSTFTLRLPGPGDGQVAKL